MRYIAGDNLKDVEANVKRVLEAAVAHAGTEDAGLVRAGGERYAAALAVFAANRERCAKVLDLMDDDASRVEYVREIVFKLMQKSFGPLFAVEHTDGMSFEYIDSYDANVRELLASGGLPALRGASERNLFQFLKTTFLFEQYRHPPLVDVKPGDVFLDCGACYGDVSLWAAFRGAAKVYAFEPEVDNYRLLRENMNEFAPGGVIETVPLALGREKGFLNLSSEVSSSRFVEDGGVRVEVVALDEWLRTANAGAAVKPDFIKMDLEGAETLALAGAETAIRFNAPRLAISIYHNFSDLWEIPLMLKEFHPAYRFFCKKHHPIHECILYAIDKGK